MFMNLPFLAAFVPYNIVPISELYAWSNNQKIHILFHKIAELVKASNNYDDLFNEIKSLLDDFDDEMKKQLQALLQQMYEDGSFNEMLAEIAEDYFNNITAPKTFKIDTRREFRICRPVMPYNSTTVSGEWYSYNQGGKMFKRENTLYYVGCYKIARTDNTYHNNDNADIRIYYYSSVDQEWKFLRNHIYSVGHANDICYSPDYDCFLVVHSSEYNQGDTETGSKNVTVIDFNLPNNPIGTFSLNSTSITRDRITCIDYFDGKYYALIGSGGDSPINIYQFDFSISGGGSIIGISNFTSYATFNIPTNAETPYVMQGAGFCQNENFMFIGNTAPAGIYRFNKITKELDCFYEIGNKTNNNMFPTGEVENLSCVDNKVYIGTAIHGNQQLYYYDYNQVFSFDFINNLQCPTGVVTSYGGTYRVITLGTQYYTLDSENKKVWYYDEHTINSAKREISNPNGLNGNYGDPFPTWEEAILFINAQDLWDTITIQQQTIYMVEYVCINSTKNIFIDGAGPFNRRGGDSDNPLHYSRMGGIYIDGTNICIDHMWIQNLSPLNLTSYSTHQIFVRNSNAAIHSSVFYVTGRSNLGQVYDNNILSVNRGFLNTSYLRPVHFSDNQFSFGSKYVLSATEGEGTSQSPYYLKYISCYQCTINAFGDYVKGDTTGSFDKFFILS